MIKKVVVLVTILLISVGFAAKSFTELIEQIGENVITSYTKPFVNGFGAALNTGLYHSAASHKMGGFDLQVKAMYIPIPEDDKTFHYKVPGLYYNTATQQIDTTWFEGNASTVFGPSGNTVVYQGQDTLAIPPELPGGVGLSFMPFIMPQLSVGLYYGSELMIRFIPTIELPMGDTKQELGFWGIGIKQDITQLPIPFANTLPLNIALQGVYQNLKVGDIVQSSALNINLHASKSFVLITPYVGLGWEDAKIKFEYSKEINTIGSNGQPVTDTVDIKKTFTADNKIRLVVGTTFNLGPMLLNVAYNLSKYNVISAGLGVSLR